MSDKYHDLVALQHREALRSRLGLSLREFEVLLGILSGQPYKRIASKIGISIHTVDNYSRRLFRKLGVNSRSAVAATAMAEYARILQEE